MGRRETQQLGQPFLVCVILADAFLEHDAEVFPERGVARFLGGVFVVGQRLQHRQNPLGRAFADRLHVTAFLQQFTRHVQRQVGAVDHALDEAQVDRHQRLGVVHDEDALDVELDAAALVAVPQVERRLGRDVQKLRVLAAPFDAVVRVGQRCFGVVAELLVELGVFLGRDVGLAARPQGSCLVDRRPLVFGDLLLRLGVPLVLLHQDRQGNVVRVLADHRLELPGAQEFFFAGAQVQGHAGAARWSGDGLDLEVTGAFRAPAHAHFRRQPRAARLDADAVGHDEAAVKAHAELADQLRILLLVAFERGHEFARAALGNRAQVSDRLVSRHADAVVGDGDRLGFGVERNAHFQVRCVLEQRGIVQRLEAQLVAGVGCVGHQLAQENFLVRVERVGDEVQDLLDLGLEREGFFVHDLFEGVNHSSTAPPGSP